MLGISKATNQQKKKIRTLRKISLLTPLLLIYLVENNNLPFTRLIKKIKTTKKVFGAMVDKNKVKAKIFLQQISISLLKKRKKPLLH